MVLVKSKFSMRFGGVELMQWIDGVTNIDRNIGQNRTASLLKVAHTNGELFQYTTASRGTITVTALIFNDIHRRELAQALMSDKPQQLIFGDEPDKYYLAIADGQAALAEAYYNNVLTLTFIVPDGIAHSVATQTADNMPYKDVPVNLLTGTSNTQYYTISGSNWIKGSQSINGGNKSIPGTPGASYTYSAIVESATFSCFPELQFFDSNKQLISTVGNTAKTDVGLRYASGVAPAGTAFLLVHMVLNNPTDSQTVVFNSEKLEQNATASPWSPNPADPEYYSDTITVHNAGTAPTAPVLTATMTADNGLVAWTNDQGGVLQFGDPGEVDGVTTKAAEVVLTEGFDSDPGGTVNSVLTNYPNYGGTAGQANVQTGSMSYGGKYVGATAMAPVYGAKAAYWGGPSLLLPFPANSHGANTGNIVTYTRQYFDTDVSKMGRMEVSLSGDGSIVFESVLRDSMAGGDQIVWECWYGSKLMASTVLNRKTFSNGHLYELRIWRFSTVIGFQLARVASVTDNVAKLAAPLVKTFNITSREPIDSVGFWFCRWQDRTAPTMGVTDFKGQWTDVDEWNDFANRFSAGDVVVADVANKRIMVNGVEDMTLHRVGNRWDSFWIQPGANTIRPVASDWATPFGATVEYREAWL